MTSIVLSGYGKMGKEIHSMLKEREDIKLYTSDNIMTFDTHIASQSVCIDFSTPEAFKSNYKFIADNFQSAVVGTTGWDDIKEEVISYFTNRDKSMIYASNFSVGVNLFLEIARISSKLLNHLADYDQYIIEYHHKFKLDSPSGTAASLREIVDSQSKTETTIQSIRSGYIPGIHTLGFESAEDSITLTHEAYSRRGFAAGAISAAFRTLEIKGVFDLRILLRDTINQTLNFKI